jgi:hypothetical protein
MLCTASTIKGYTIAASDGPIGTVSDFLFDDKSWRVRWMVVDTGKWLTGRKVLLPPLVLGNPESMAREFSVRLTTRQVKESPEIDTDRPVSRQMETHIYDYYGWGPYWGDSLYMGGYGYGAAAMAPAPYLGSRQREAAEIAAAQQIDGDPHLRSTEAVTGYHIHATDGAIGHVEDFLLGDIDWSIRYLVVDTKNWWPGKHVLVSPRSAGGIDWQHRLVNLKVDRQKVKDSPAYDASTAVDRAFEDGFRKYYGHDFQPGNQA